VHGIPSKKFLIGTVTLGLKGYVLCTGESNRELKPFMITVVAIPDSVIELCKLSDVL
jgi:hypothetical protein